MANEDEKWRHISDGDYYEPPPWWIWVTLVVVVAVVAFGLRAAALWLWSA